MKKPPSLYVQTVAHLCISVGKGALFGVRWCGDAWRKVRCGGGVRMGVGGRKYAQTWAGVRCGGRMRMGVGGRKYAQTWRGYAAEGAPVWRCVEEGALRWGRGGGDVWRKVRCLGCAGAEMCGGRCAAEGAGVWVWKGASS